MIEAGLDIQNAIYPEVVQAELEAYRRSVFRYFFEVEHISIELNGCLVYMRRNRHCDVAASSECRLLRHVHSSKILDARAFIQTRDSYLYERFKSTIDHAFTVKRLGARLHHVGEARVLHHCGVDLITVFA